MRQINCYIPIKLRITGRPSDTQLDALEATLARCLAARIALAERTLASAGSAVLDHRAAEPGRERFDPSRANPMGVGYSVPSYQASGKQRVIRWERQPGSALNPFIDELEKARTDLRDAIERARSDEEIVTLRRTVTIMEAEVGPALPVLYPGTLGPFEWHMKALHRAGAEQLPPQLGEEALEAIWNKEREYIDLAGQLTSYRARSLRLIQIPKRGISYLIRENEETEIALNAVADEFRKWFTEHQFDRRVLTNDARWGLGEMLAERADLLVALRAAQREPIESEKFYEDIEPFFETVTEIAISFIPIVGSAVALYEVYTGEDLFGYELDTVDRAILAASVLLPFVGRFIKGGRALYTAERMATLYGRDARQWSRVMSAGERLASHPDGSKLLRESSDIVRSGKHVAEDAARRTNMETLLKHVFTAEEPTAKAASRTEAAVQPLEQALNSISSKYAVLRDLTLDAPAVDRVLAKGPDLSHMKGQLLEELLESRVRQMLGTQAGKVRLGLEDVTRRLEFIPGHLIRDRAGRQLTDGIIAVREGDTLRVLTIFEAKAGSRSARGLRLSSTVMSDLSEAERAELHAYAGDVLRDLREEAKTAGKSITLTIEDLEKEIILSEQGGQIRRDIERLAPGTDERSVRIFVGELETQVIVGPRSTKVVGVLPLDVKEGRMTQDLTSLGYMFDVLKINITEGDLVSLIADLTKTLKP